jgi:hypothetical protein
MATDRAAVLSVPVAAALLLWPALWNGYPIVFADTGTYLSQAIHRYAGWDRPVFYSLFMVPLHATVTTWPVVAVQALLAAWVLRLACRVLAPGLPEAIYLAAMAALSVGTWLPWLVCALMPDVFTPLLVLVLCMLALVPERIKHRERTALAGLATIMIASQLSSLPLACALAGALLVIRTAAGPRQRPHGRPSGPRDAPPPRPDVTTDSWMASERVASAWMAGTRPATTIERRPCCTLSPALTATGSSSTMTAVAPSAAPAPATRRIRAWRLVMLPPALAVLGLCAVNLAAHGRFAIAPFGDVFLLARVLYDGPGMTVLQRDCPASGWRLCPLLDRFPPTSDDFL